jgi:Mrp family chromosome partitioning ATPase
MSKECDHNCSGCSSNCSDRTEENTTAKTQVKTEEKTDFTEKPNALSKIKKVIGVVSGKGGVGKSIVTSLLAVLMNRNEYKTAILDADITGPSIPKAFGLNGRADASDLGIFPVKTKMGIKVISTNLLLENVTDPVIWRGPLIANMVKQFWTDVIWDDIDFMFIDMPPGTGDVPLTVFQSMPVDGIIIVTSPQELVSMIVEKAVKMAEQMNIPILGVVENMSYVKCPDCNKEIKIFGDSKIEEVAKRYNLEVLGKLPIDPKLAAGCDHGMIELFAGDWLNKAADKIEKLLTKEEK